MTSEIVEGSAVIVKEDNTFFNPAQKLNRDITAEVIKEYFKDRDSIRILTAMSATGLRGIRYLKEIPKSKLFFNDICPNAVQTIQKNLILNSFEDFKVFSENENLRETDSRINVTRNDCHVLMHRYHSFFDVIDIDPFGSCAEFVNSAFKAIKHNGIICFTCTDKAALCTNESKCFMKYNSTIKKVFCKNETPIRVLLSHISREFAKYDAKIIPILSLSVDFYVRVIVRVYKGKGKTVLTDNSFVSICDCYRFSQIPLASAKGSVCSTCNTNTKLYGPFWTGPIHDRVLVDGILENIIEKENERMVGILRLIRQETEDLFYYEIPKISSLLKINCCKLRDIMNGLSNSGYSCSLTHCDNNSFKTNASIDTIIELMKEIDSKSFFKYSIAENPVVTAIFSNCFYKGKVMSGLGPLSLPKQ